MPYVSHRRWTLRRCACLALTLSFQGSAGTALATPPPDGGLAFVQGTVAHDGQCRKTLLVSCSPDDPTVSFTNGLYFLDRGGAVRRRVALPPGAYAARPSPDGGAIAYSDPASGTLVLATAAGSHPRVLRRQGAYAIAWAPNGRALAYTRAGSTRPALWITDLRGHARELATGDPKWPVFASDGRHVLFVRARPYVHNDACYRSDALYSVSVRGGSARRVFSPPLPCGEIAAPDMSATAGRLLIELSNGARGQALDPAVQALLGVDVLALASGKLRRVLPLPTATVWSPDGRRIAFVGRCIPPSAALCTARPDGTDIRALGPLPSDGDMFGLTWLRAAG